VTTPPFDRCSRLARESGTAGPVKDEQSSLQYVRRFARREPRAISAAAWAFRPERILRLARPYEKSRAASLRRSRRNYSS